MGRAGREYALAGEGRPPFAVITTEPYDRARPVTARKDGHLYWEKNMDVYRPLLTDKQLQAIHRIAQLARILPAMESKSKRVLAKDELLLLSIAIFTGKLPADEPEPEPEPAE